MNLFVDSAAWQALYAANDKYHALAARAFRELADQKITFCVTDYVFDEAITLLLNRVGHDAARRCGEWLLSSERVRFIRIDPDQWDEAWEIFKHYEDKAFSFTDCTSFVVMRQLRLHDAFTFDRHFEQMGFRLWPK
jgi:predicted nucleic acid-binding protein